MNLIDRKWIKKGNNDKVLIKYENKKIIIENNDDNHNFIIYPKLFKTNSKSFINIKFEGKTIEGNGCTLKLLNRHKTILSELSINSEIFIDSTCLKYYICVIYIAPKSKCEIDSIKLEYTDEENYLNYFNNDTLVVSPCYPSMDNKYSGAFVHTRVKAYIKNGFKVDVACINDFYNATSVYEYDGINVFKSNYYHLRNLLQEKKYKRILIHFFDDKYANVLESVDVTDSKLYFYLHGAETLYRDWSKISSPYFGDPAQITDDLEKKFQIKDYYIKKYNGFKNAKWIFVTNWTKERCEELLDIKFNNWDVIPCLIDTDLFYYEKKKPELRKKIFVLRKFSDINSYSLDTAVRVVLELSRRSFFQDLEIDFYGDGELFEKILKPVRQFSNVHCHRTFLTHKQIKEVHKSHGIALFPTRFDSQAVSSCEAASSGCAVITSDIPGVRQFIPKELGVMCDSENYKQYADIIEKMYFDEEYFYKVGKEESESVQSKFNYDNTIKKELEMFENEQEDNYFCFEDIKKPILTVVIPSYNVSKFLRGTVISLLDQPYANKIEILIVNDGSKDNTLEIGKELEKLTTVKNKSIVKVIDKPNGGHGSTINKGIELAQGKYLKVIDGDDTVDSEEFAKLIKILETEDSDIVLNNYIEDYAITNTTNLRKIYNLLKPNIQYHFDDLCYENYGFTSWGPILSCSTYKTSMLRDNNIRLSEKMFYVDMELNINVAIACDTITYYDLNIYRYLLGRPSQSISKKSYTKNYKDHENVTINMINTLYNNEKNISASKREYIVNKLILPMVKTQYFVCINYFRNGKAFREFETRLKKYKEFYDDPTVATRGVKLYRNTKGILIKIHPILIRIVRLFR